MSGTIVGQAKTKCYTPGVALAVINQLLESAGYEVQVDYVDTFDGYEYVFRLISHKEPAMKEKTARMIEFSTRVGNELGMLARVNTLLDEIGYRLVAKNSEHPDFHIAYLEDMRICHEPYIESMPPEPIGPRTMVVNFNDAVIVVEGPRPLVTEELPNEFDTVAWQLPIGFTVKSVDR